MPRSTPNAKAAARVPPPENASAIAVSPPTSGGDNCAMGFEPSDTGVLAGGLNVAQPARSRARTSSLPSDRMIHFA